MERKESKKDGKFLLVKSPPRASGLTNAGRLVQQSAAKFKGARAKGNKKSAMGGLIDLPPQIENTLKVRSRIRYVAGSNNIVSVSVADLIGSFGGTCTVTNSVFKPWASSARIRRMVLWPSASASTELNTATVSWNSGVSGLNRDSERTKDVPEGVLLTGRVVFKPPRKSVASDWMAASIGTTNIFTLTCSVGTLMDFEAEFTLANQFTSGTQTIATGTLGSLYYLPIDGASSHQYFPVHLPTTF